ncbi:BRO1-like domain-domain-containing protein [Protomyces lactucae-debilis]|uniref:BRO domain-containing protein 1 n=1 Tax=Protomyces lactucae-debilis TaxID=2754530 RepID=A0A1Y2FGC7_PROLT|nr:BRO1-like domain-containing protein [Protomyces lactucae-debilis]ORY82677.1 BRO1-like domain-domain-containing protein [Protomyces lactucae-debilis]
MAAPRQAPMIFLPMKQTDEVDLIRPLRHFIGSNYGQAEKYTEECKTFNRLRQDMCGAGRDEVGRDLLYRYYGQLELLELRFPIGEDHIRISFNWHDAFTEAEIAQFSLAYEKACVLFNIAAILSYTAASQTRTEIEGMKRAYHCFQACAGLLSFINDNFLHAPSTDLSREMVKTLSTVMLAQAQEVFTEQQVRSAGKSTIIAKLAAETANLYQTAAESLTELVLAGNIDRVWLPYAQCKERYFSCLAQYHQAIVDDSKAAYGVSVARFTVASTLAKEASSSTKSHANEFARYPHMSNDPGAALIDLVKVISEEVNDKYAAAKKENDLIYHELVAKESALPPVGKLASAKSISLTSLYAGQDVSRIVGNDIFSKLVPLAVHESASLYSDEVDKMLRAEQERSEIGDTELSTALEYLGLPKSLHRFKQSDDKLAQELQSVSQDLQEMQRRISQQERRFTGGLAGRVEANKAARERVAAQLQQSQEELDKEARGWSGMRGNYGDRWTQQPSEMLTKGLRENLASIAASLRTATESDAKLEQSLAEIAEEVKDLGNADPEHLEVVFRNILISAGQGGKQSAGAASLLDLGEDEAGEREVSNAIAVKVDHVDDLVRKVALVKKERHTTLDDLKTKARADDIAGVLILNRKTPGIEQRVFAVELEKFRPHRTRIAATLARQDQLVEELTQVFAQVLEDKTLQKKQAKWQQATREKQEKVSKLERAGMLYAGLAQSAEQAAAFYEQLSGLASGILAQVQQYVQARQQEGRSLMQSLRGGGSSSAEADIMRQRLERLNMGAQGPQRPPQQPPYGGGGYSGY